ncbi:IS1/IS1595 family N-terminal zinc-binding domain-containing protein [Kordia algicida]|uniref:IS1/IS1595 family N-terminal zinc-binding domain-containing protein n=1 Tax=Kordia algicida TaxID=221066 RepID=UPI003D9BB095
MEKIQCPNCRSRAVKNGFQSDKQRYKCISCNKKFHLKYTYEAYNKHTNSFIISLLKEGCGIRSISRVLKISKKTG